jgi:hypothetical protein
MSGHNTLQIFNILRAKRSLLWIGAAIICTLLIVATIMSSNAMARSSMQQTGNTNKALAVITNSGSTNAPAFTLTINQDGSGSLVYQKGNNAQRFNRFNDKTFPAGTFDSHQLSSLLTKIKDVSTIPDHGCLKSASFGTTTRITFQGKTSGDLSCLSNQDAALFLNLKHLVQTMSTHISTSSSSDIL